MKKFLLFRVETYVACNGTLKNFYGGFMIENYRLWMILIKHLSSMNHINILDSFTFMSGYL